MKQDTFLKKIPAVCLGVAALLTSACSQQAPEPTAKRGKPSHIWSDQVETLYEAKEVAKQVNELQAIKDMTLQERRGGH